MEIQDITRLEPENLLNCLDNYQKELVKSLLEQTDNNYLEAADKWLSANPTNTAQFGGDQSHSKIFREKLIDEIEKLLCGQDSTYEEERNKLNDIKDKGEKYIVGLISTAIGSQLGVAGAFIAPVIVLFLMSTGKLCLNAWCNMRKEIKEG